MPVSSEICNILSIVASLDHLEHHSFLNDNKHGFRQKKKLRNPANHHSPNVFSSCLNKHEQVDAVLLDFSKALNKAHYKILLTKLSPWALVNPSTNGYAHSYKAAPKQFLQKALRQNNPLSSLALQNNLPQHKKSLRYHRKLNLRPSNADT